MTVQIAQTYQFTDQSQVRPFRIQAELNTIASAINNANAGLLTWDNIKATTGTITTLTMTNAPILSSLTASTALVADSSKHITSSATTSTELGYVSGVTSAIQTQLNGKASTSLGNLSTPVANVAIDMGSHKITSLTNGSASSDAAAFGQIPTGFYSDRGDPASDDFTSLTADSAWHDLDLSTILASGANAALLKVSVSNTAAGNYIQFRKKGNTNATAVAIMRSQVGGVSFDGCFVVGVDTNRKCQYFLLNSGVWTINGVTVIGWWK